MRKNLIACPLNFRAFSDAWRRLSAQYNSMPQRPALAALRHFVVLSCLAGTLVVGAPVLAKASRHTGKTTFSATQQAVLAVEHALLQARVSTDPAFHIVHFDENARYMHSSGRIQNKAEVLKMVAERPWVSWRKSEQKVQMYGDTAITHALLTVRLVDRRTETVRATGVYVNESGRWRQVSWQSSAGTFVGPAPEPGGPQAFTPTASSAGGN